MPHQSYLDISLKVRIVMYMILKKRNFGSVNLITTNIPRLLNISINFKISAKNWRYTFHHSCGRNNCTWEESKSSIVQLQLKQSYNFNCNFYEKAFYHIETSPLIRRANQWTGFYIIGASVIKKLITERLYFTVPTF